MVVVPWLKVRPDLNQLIIIHIELVIVLAVFIGREEDALSVFKGPPRMEVCFYYVLQTIATPAGEF